VVREVDGRPSWCRSARRCCSAPFAEAPAQQLRAKPCAARTRTQRDQGIGSLEIRGLPPAKKGLHATIGAWICPKTWSSDASSASCWTGSPTSRSSFWRNREPVGKSTALRTLAEHLNGEVLDLDDLATRDATLTDPTTVIASSGLTCIDEYRHAPAVLDAIKVQLNRSTRPGQFILTGSARHESLPVAAQALTGRLHRMAIYRLAQSELEGTAPNLLARLFAEPEVAITGTAIIDKPRGLHRAPG